MNRHGGNRKGSGRKPDLGERKVTTSMRITPTLKAYLSEHGLNAGSIFEDWIRKSKQFKEWIKGKEAQDEE